MIDFDRKIFNGNSFDLKSKPQIRFYFNFMYDSMIFSPINNIISTTTRYDVKICLIPSLFFSGFVAILVSVNIQRLLSLFFLISLFDRKNFCRIRFLVFFFSLLVFFHKSKWWFRSMMIEMIILIENPFCSISVIVFENDFNSIYVCPTSKKKKIDSEWILVPFSLSLSLCPKAS